MTPEPLQGMQPSSACTRNDGKMFLNSEARTCHSMLLMSLYFGEYHGYPHSNKSYTINITTICQCLCVWCFINKTSVRFGRCDICFHLTEAINDRNKSLEEKLADVKTYRDHLHSQFVDRTVQWSLNELSQDHNSGTLVVLVDGLDQAKFRVPRHPKLRPVSSMPLYFNMDFSWVS